MQMRSISLAGSLFLSVSAASAQAPFCEPAGSTNCGTCNEINDLVVCKEEDSSTGRSAQVMTGVNEGTSYLFQWRYPSSSGACPSGFTPQGPLCQKKDVIPGVAKIGSLPVQSSAPDFKCSTVNGAHVCALCTIDNGAYTCDGVDTATRIVTQNVINLTTFSTTTYHAAPIQAGNKCPQGMVIPNGSPLCRSEIQTTVKFAP